MAVQRRLTLSVRRVFGRYLSVDCLPKYDKKKEKATVFYAPNFYHEELCEYSNWKIATFCTQLIKFYFFYVFLHGLAPNIWILKM